MDTFKIISIIFMMIVIYQIYQINCVVFKDKVEGFEGTTQSLGGVDDTNAINTLAQIAKNLMAGGITVPGNMAVTGTMTVNGVLNPAVGVWHTSTDGKPRIHYGGNSHSYYRTADAHVWRNSADQDKMVLFNDGTLTVQGRNVLAELDKLNSHWNGNNLTVDSITSSGEGIFRSPITISTGDNIPLRLVTPGGNQSKILMKGGGKAARFILDNNGHIYSNDNEPNYA